MNTIKKAPAFTLFEAVGGWLCLVFGFIFTHFVCGYACGIWGGIFWAAAGAAGAIYTRAKHLKTSAAQRVVFIISEAFCLVPVLYSNLFINFLAAAFSFVLLLYLAVSVSGAELFGKHFVMDALKAIFLRPFISFSAAPRAAFSLFRGGKRAKNLLFVLLGLCAALIWGAWSAQRQDALARKMIRLHVIANSNSAEDQALKLEVRDKVLNFTTNVLQRSVDMEDAQMQLQDALDRIENIAQREIVN